MYNILHLGIFHAITASNLSGASCMSNLLCDEIIRVVYLGDQKVSNKTLLTIVLSEENQVQNV